MVQLIAERLDDLIHAAALRVLGILGRFKNVVQVLELTRDHRHDLEFFLKLFLFLFHLLEIPLLTLQVYFPAGQLVKGSLLPQDGGIELHLQAVYDLGSLRLLCIKAFGKGLDAGL